MDPVTVLGVAGSIIQIVDFSVRFFSQVKSLCSSVDGEFEEFTNLRSDARRLLQLNASVTKALKEREGASGLTELEKDALTICIECEATSDELFRVLKDILGEEEAVLGDRTGYRRLLGAARVAVKAIWKQKKLNKLQSRLESLRGILVDTILVNMHNSLTYEASKTAAQPIDVSWGGTLDFGQWIDTHKEERDMWKDGLMSAVRSSHWRMLESLEKKRFDGLYSWQSTPVAQTLTSSLLTKLPYHEIADRAERIPEAYTKTFEWIFSDSPNNPHQQSWSSFRDWLSRDSSIYWITGKAGSGKSTLMKMLCQDQRTMSLLREWSGSRLLITANFYFWNSGTSLQMSQEGLLRSLLYQALVQRLNHTQDLSLMSSKWATVSLLTPSLSLSWTDLSQAFRFLIEENGEAPAKFAFFIDGLDEYSGTASKLLSLVHNLASYPNVKVCVSSRPWTVFEDSFKQRPNLMLQHWTYADIALYAREKMSANPAFSELQEYDPDYASNLVESITTKASGVFLWVVLVVFSLLEGLEQGDKPAELHERLNELPEELDNLFGKMLHGLKGAHFQDAAQLFKIFRTAARKPSVLVMSFADDDDHEWAINGHVAPLSAREIWYRSIAMKRRLNSRCRGLLEIAPLRMGLPQSVIWTGNSAKRKPSDTPANHSGLSYDGSYKASVSNLEVSHGHLLASATIEYLHRTVKDFLALPRVSALIDEATQSTSDVHAALFRAYLSYLKIMPVDVVDQVTFWRPIILCLEIAVDLAYKDENLLVRYLDALDDVASQLASLKNSEGHNFIQRYWAAVDCHWVSTLSQGQLKDNFYTLVVHCRLVEYLRTKFQLAPPTKQLASRLLETAMMRQNAPRGLCIRPDADVRLHETVQVLLGHGADGNLYAAAEPRKKKRVTYFRKNKGLTSGDQPFLKADYERDDDPQECSSLVTLEVAGGGVGFTHYATNPYHPKTQNNLRAIRLEFLR